MKRILALLVMLVLAFTLPHAVGCGGNKPAEAAREGTAIEAGDGDAGTGAESGGADAGHGGNAALDENGESASSEPASESASESASGEGDDNSGAVVPETDTESPGGSETGVPVYPGAILDPGNSATINTGSQPVPAQVTIVSYITSDSLAQVTDFYRSVLGEPMDSTASTADWLQGNMASGNYLVVHLELKNGEVNISIVRSAASSG